MAFDAGSVSLPLTTVPTAQPQHSTRLIHAAYGEVRIDAWTDADASMFVWLLHYNGAGTLQDADRAYYASPERAALEPDPSRWIVDTTTLSLEPVGEESP